MNEVIYDTKEKILAQLKHCGLERIIRRREIQALLTAFDTRLQLERRLNIAVEGLEKYADESNWVGVAILGKEATNHDLFVPSDNGYQVARETLDKVKEKND